jgi:hypothetical protein
VARRAIPELASRPARTFLSTRPKIIPPGSTPYRTLSIDQTERLPTPPGLRGNNITFKKDGPALCTASRVSAADGLPLRQPLNIRPRDLSILVEFGSRAREDAEPRSGLAPAH